MADFKELIAAERRAKARRHESGPSGPSDYHTHSQASAAASKIEPLIESVLGEFADHIGALVECKGTYSSRGHCTVCYTLFEKAIKKAFWVIPYTAKGTEIMDVVVGKYGGEQYAAGLCSILNGLLLSGQDFTPQGEINEQSLREALAKFYAHLRPPYTCGDNDYYIYDPR